MPKKDDTTYTETEFEVLSIGANGGGHRALYVVSKLLEPPLAFGDYTHCFLKEVLCWAVIRTRELTRAKPSGALIDVGDWFLKSACGLVLGGYGLQPHDHALARETSFVGFVRPGEDPADVWRCQWSEDPMPPLGEWDGPPECSAESAPEGETT